MSVEIKRFGNPEKAFFDGVNAGTLELCTRIAAQAKSLAPVDTALLRNSITWKTYNQQGPGDPLAVNPKQGVGYVGTSVLYGVYQELGTKKMAPQPFMRPAVAIVRGENPAQVLAKIQREQANGPLKLGVKRVRFN